MIGKVLAVGMFAALAAAAQSYVTRAWFPDGAGVDVYTETTGPTQQTVPSGGGMISYGQVKRIVQDSQFTIVFAYVLEAGKAPDSDAITIRIKPATGVATVSGVREFPEVKRGQEVKIEILGNRATGERVYDVLRPAEGTNPAPGQGSVRVMVIPAAGAAKLVVNGQALAVRNNWSAGKPARLYLPGHGSYYLSWENRPKFRLAGYMQGNRLVFLLDTEYVELTFEGNVLTTAEGGPVWIYHDAGFVSAGFVSRDTAELDVADLEALHAK